MTTWTEFWQGHGNRNFTAVFNTFLDSQIADARVDLPFRVLAWVLRNAWGRFSDACIDAEGIRLGQVDCARDLKVLRRNRKTGELEPNRDKVSDVFQKLARWNMVRSEGRSILPVDNPLANTFADSSPFVEPISTNGDENTKVGVDWYLENVWKLSKPTAYEAYQNSAREYKKWRTELVTDYKAAAEMSDWGPTSEEEDAQNVGLGSDNDAQNVGLGSDNGAEKSRQTGPYPYKSYRTVKQLASFSREVLQTRIQTLVTDLKLPFPNEQTLTNLRRALMELSSAEQMETALACFDRDLREAASRRENKPRKLWGLAVSVLADAVSRVRSGRATAQPSAADEVPDHHLPTSVRRLRQQVREFEAKLATDTGNEGLQSELAYMQNLLAEEERYYGIERKPAESETRARAKEAGQR